MRRALACAALACAFACASHRARAEAVRPGAAATIPAAHAPTDAPLLRGDNQRTGRAQGFPSALSPLWKIQLQGGTDFPAVSARGALVVASAGDLVSIDAATGREVARTTLPAAAAQAPLITTRNDRVALTTGGECVLIAPDGAVRHRRPLPLRPRDGQVAPILTRDGGLVLAAGTSLLRLDAEARVVDSVRLAEAPVGALLEGPTGALAIAASGKVFRWKPPGAPVLVGSLGGPPSATTALAGRHLVAVVESRKLVFFDLSAGTPSTTLASGSTFEGAPAVASGGEVWVSSAGVLLSLNSDGKELDRAVTQGTTGSPLVADKQVAYLRSSGELVVWSKEGGERTTDLRACNEPLSVLSDGSRVFVNCRDGTVAAFGAVP